jgi:transcriptional regulator with XRE-family HTH domain
VAKKTRRVPERVGARVRLLREEAGLSIEHVALESGIDKSHLSRLERGQRNTSFEVLFAIADSLGVLVVDLVAIGEDPRTRLVRATRGMDPRRLSAMRRELPRKG